MYSGRERLDYAVPPPWETTRSIPASAPRRSQPPLSFRPREQKAEFLTAAPRPPALTSGHQHLSGARRNPNPPACEGLVTLGALCFSAHCSPDGKCFRSRTTGTSSLSLGYFDRTGRSWWKTPRSHSRRRSSLCLAKAEIILEQIQRPWCHNPGLRALRSELFQASEMLTGGGQR